jgi:PEP-CTERM motif
MNRLISTCLALSAIVLIAPNSANAAAIGINDAGTEGSIVFSANDFEGGISLDGTLLQSGLNNLQSRTVSEGTAGAPITHTFSGTWLTPGGLTPSTQTIAFQEGSTPPSQGVSDILTLAFSNTTLGGAAAGLVTGTFVSDLDPSLLPLPAGATVVSEATPFLFSAPFLTGSATSDVDVAVPEPASLALLGSALLGFGFLRFRRKTG